MKKLVIATDNYYPRHDGITRVLGEIVPRLKDYDIRIIAPGYKGKKDSIVDGVNIIRVPLHKFSIGDFQPAKLKSKLIRNHIKDADIVFTHSIGPVGGMAMYHAWRQKKKLVSFIHSVEWELVPMAMKSYFLRKISYPVMRTIVRFFYKKADLIVVPAQNILDLLRWVVGNVPTRVIHLGCDTKAFVPPKSKKEAKEAVGIDPDTVVIGYHGRLGREKDLKTLVRGYVRSSKKRRTKLLVLGEGLASIRKTLDHPRIIHHESVDEVLPYLQAMDIYVLTSLTETTCLSILEAMSCEVPVITTRVGFVKDYIKEGRNGLFIDFQYPHQLAKKIDYLIENPVKRKAMGKMGRETVVKLFDWNKTVLEIKDAFESLD